MPLKPAGVAEAQQLAANMQGFQGVPTPTPVKSYGDTKDARILYQGLSQACIQSMAIGQFSPDLETHLKNVLATVDALAEFVLLRSK